MSLFAVDKQPRQIEVKIKTETQTKKSCHGNFPWDAAKENSNITSSTLQRVVKLCAFCASQYVDKKSGWCTSVASITQQYVCVLVFWGIFKKGITWLWYDKAKDEFESTKNVFQICFQRNLLPKCNVFLENLCERYKMSWNVLFLFFVFLKVSQMSKTCCCFFLIYYCWTIKLS